MKVGYGKDGLTINSKKIDPYSFSYKKVSIDFEEPEVKSDTMSTVERFYNVKNSSEEVTKLEKFKTFLASKS
ncbi:hypothetical protein [Ruminiclostridium papyrosolvens]|uniref:Uncharacterized protein n=1 Tax=Ruminiclostridium papyrosolvens C7 TaxID=1330534 RepID=U4R1D1_9FIRM|nr:hypothetical protein [Ruminiclostridium papyrosolvens]EPR10480.1 hypothetical protein L323_12600 [Ruminiclostridium papyrosolvens C7]